MTTALTPGANTALPASATSVTIRLVAASGHADPIALLLDGAGRADGDHGVVLFSQPVAGHGAVSLDVPSDTLTIALGALPAPVERVLVVAQADGASDVTGCGTLTATVSADGLPIAEAAFATLPAVATLQLVELYRRGGAWKIRALGDGYAEGLVKLLTVHGVEVDELAPVAPPATVAPVAPRAPAAPVAPVVRATAALPQLNAPLNLRKAEGKLNLKKGQQGVLMTKTERITARVSWSSGTDYDVYALVLMRDGTAVDVAAFAAEGVPPRLEHAGVRHLGDVAADASNTFAERTGSGPTGGLFSGRKKTLGEVSEVVEIRLTPQVLAVVPVAYSAINNGGGSFRHYKVSMEIDNGAGTKITIPSTNASDNPGVYTCVPALIRNSDEGVVIEALERYSKSGSEKRPVVKLVGGEVIVEMDAGPVNLPKDD